MRRRALIAVLLSLTLSGPALAAKPAVTTAAVVKEALDLFCKPFLTEGNPDYTAAGKAGWEFGSFGMFREGDWGRVNVDSRIGRSCDITVPDSGSKGKQLVVLDTVSTWAKASGFSLGAPRKTETGTRPYDVVSETWSQTGGPNKLNVYAYVNRHTDMLLPDVEIHVAAP